MSALRRSSGKRAEWSLTMKKILKIAIISILSLVLLIFGLMSLGIVYTNYRSRMDPIQYESVDPDYYHKQQWQTSTPEEQGMNSNNLIEMVEFYEKEHSKTENIAIDSITIIRNGYVVADIYLNPLYPKDTEHIIRSCTKSIMSALIGIAIERGHIKNVDVPVIDILNDKNIENR